MSGPWRVGDGGRGEGDVGADGDPSGRLFYVDAGGAGVGLVVVGALPLQVLVAVVVRRSRPPRCSFAGRCEELAALRSQMDTGTPCARVEGADCLVGGHLYVSVAFSGGARPA